MGLLKSKLMLRLTLAVSVFGVAVGGVSTMAWFQINNSVAPAQNVTTKALQTDTAVYQEDSHANDDAYQRTPINDYGGTLSYDHAKGGVATNYFIREYDDDGVEQKTTQMYTNAGSQGDKAVIYNFTFTSDTATCFKIYNANDANDLTAYFGYDQLVTTSPTYSDFSRVITNEGVQGKEVRDNISLGANGKYYDIYLNKDNQIWIAYHGEITTSDVMGNETAWYICGAPSSDPNSSFYQMDRTMSTGIKMYVNAAYGQSGTYDKAYYAGLRVAPGDVFWIMYGGNLTKHYTTEAERTSSNFDHTPSGDNGTITAKSGVVGYYTIALTRDETVYIASWDGFEVDGKTRYNEYNITYKDQGGSDCTATNTSGLVKKYNSKETAVLVNGVKDGYTFGGWYSNPSCTGDVITSIPSNSLEGDITLYAKWTTNPVPSPLNSISSYGNVERKVRRNTAPSSGSDWIYLDLGGNGAWTSSNYGGGLCWIKSWGGGSDRKIAVTDITGMQTIHGDTRIYKIPTSYFTDAGDTGFDVWWANSVGQEEWYCRKAGNFTVSSVQGKWIIPTEGVNANVRYSSHEIRTFTSLNTGTNVLGYEDEVNSRTYLADGYYLIGTGGIFGTTNTWNLYHGVYLGTGLGNLNCDISFTGGEHFQKVTIVNNNTGTLGNNWSNVLRQDGYYSGISNYSSGVSGSGGDVVIASGGFNATLTDAARTPYEAGSIYLEVYSTVSFNQNGGSGGRTASVKAIYGSNMPSLATFSAPTKTGYSFTGYFDNTSGGNKYYTDAGASQRTWNKVNKTFTLYAQWSAITYSIAYDNTSMTDATHGTYHPTSGNKYDAAIQISNPTKPGYIFTGWSSSAGAGLSTSTAKTGTTATPTTAWNGTATTNTYFKNLRTSSSGSITLTANWTEKTFNIVFNPNGDVGGEGSISNMSDAQIGTTLTLNNGSMTNGNRVLLGWSLNKNASAPTISDGGTLTGENADALYAAKDGNNDVTIYAIWGNVYDVTIGISNSGYGTVNSASQVVVSNVPENADISTDGGTITFSYGNFSQSVTASPAATTAEFTYALRTPNIWTNIPAGSKVTTSGIVITANFTRTTNVYNLAGSGTNYTNNGYSFYSDENKTVSITTASYGQTVYYSATGSTGYRGTEGNFVINSSTQNLTLSYNTNPKTATYNVGSATAKSWTVTLNLNGGSEGSTSVANVTYGQAMPTNGVTMPTRTGYTFAGYYDTSATSGGNQYYTSNGDSANNWNKDEDSPQLWARWTPHTITINYNANGGSGTTSSQSNQRVGDNVTLRTNDFTKTGSTFNGWNTKADGSGHSYSENTQYSVLNIYTENEFSSSGTLTLYAQWTDAVGSYYIIGTIKGNWKVNGDGAVAVNNVGYNATSVTFSNVSFESGEQWRIYRPDQSGSGYYGELWIDNSLITSSPYFSANGNNVSTNAIGVGSYNITLTISSGSVTAVAVIPVSLSFHFDQKTSTGADGSNNGAAPSSYTATEIIWSDISLDAGGGWFLEGPATSDRWGFVPNSEHHVLATEHWEYYFLQSGIKIHNDNNVYKVDNFYGMTATSITLDMSNNNIIVVIGSLNDNQFLLKNSSGTTLGTQSATSATGTVTFSNVTINKEVSWRIEVSGTTHTFGYSDIGSKVTIIDQTIDKAVFFTNNIGYANTVFGGVYTIVYNVTSHSISSVACTSLAANNFTLKQYDSSASVGSTTTVNAVAVQNEDAQYTFTISNEGFYASYYWHIEGPIAEHVWGYRTDGTNISATDNYGYWFTDSQRSLGESKPTDIKNLYKMSCVVTFDFLANTIVVSDISLANNQFKIKTSSGTVLSTASASGSTGTVSFADVNLPTDTPWYLEVGGEDSATKLDYYKHSSLPSKVSIIGVTNLNTATYFYEANDGMHNIGTGYGGVYDLTFSVTGHNFTTISCDSLLLSDFFGLRKSNDYSTANVATFTSASLETNTMVYTGGTHLYIDDELYFRNDNTATNSSSISCIHNFYFGNSGDITSADLGDSNLIEISGNKLHSKVDIDIAYTFTIVPGNENVTALFEVTGVLESRNIKFKHARDAGIYIETSSSSDFSNSSVIMMHTTTNGAYQAQEAPVYLSQNTYLRIFVTHSNDIHAIDETHDIRSVTEYYYANGNGELPGAFEQGDGYIKCVAAGTTRWTISLVVDTNYVHIDSYSGAATLSTQHNVPYYLVGQGKPGSDIRGVDYTTAKGIQLWTWGNNAHNLGCYVGSYPNGNTSPSNYKGTGINLVAGDVFRFATASKLISNSQTPVDNSNYSITSDGVVTIKKSGHYFVYLTGTTVGEELDETEGNEIICIELDGDPVSNPARNNDLIAKSQVGAALINASGNVLTFGGSLNYSLLDAVGNGGYSFIVNLTHTASSAGDVNYSFTNNSGYSIYVSRYVGSYNRANVYGDQISISDNTTDSTSYTVANEKGAAVSTSSPTNICFKITIPPEAIKDMFASGDFTFNITVSYSFVESTIS